ncbi:MAG: hypothetical protein GXN98_05030 [Euryarchaeota archaeon]|nr:hypothetical protein [Euryarchaeota archaeon]
MRIELIAADSMGTRSMATYIETPDIRLLIDPGVALAPKRYGLPPHPLELQKMEQDWRRIKKLAERSHVLVVTHYHYDHHSPEEPEIYEGKIALIKHPTSSINRSQKERAKHFLERLGELPEKLEYSDGKKFTFGSTQLTFSPPVYHGTNPRLGYVTQLAVRRGDECFLFSSDVEGPSVPEQAEFMLSQRPSIAYIDGPMSYMLGYRYSRASFEHSLENLRKLLELEELRTLILDHHLLRDLEWRQKLAELFAASETLGKQILSAAQFEKTEETMLEARRRQLYEESPP